MFNDIVIVPITIHMYGVMIAAGFLAALLMTLRRGKKRGYDEDLIWAFSFAPSSAECLEPGFYIIL